MRRLALVVAILALGALALPAAAEEDFDPHPHMLFQRPVFGEIDGHPHLISVRKCVDLANNNRLPLHAHHEHLHFGSSGVSFGGESGHVVVPAAPFGEPLFPALPWSDCDSFMGFLPFPLPEE